MLIRHATLPDGRTDFDLLVQDGRVAAVGPQLPAPEGVEVVDAQGFLLSPPFVDAHFHMDATLSYGLPRVNRSGTLLEGIALWGELKPLLTPEAIAERALAYCDWAVGRGLLAIRSHVDTCDPRLLAVEALIEVRREVAPYLDLQLVAFPQDGVLRSPHGIDTLRRALDMGVDVVAASRISNAPWRMVPPRSGRCARSQNGAACSSTCIATRPTIPWPATSRRWRARPSALGWAGGLRARI